MWFAICHVSFITFFSTLCFNFYIDLYSIEQTTASSSPITLAIVHTLEVYFVAAAACCSACLPLCHAAAADNIHQRLRCN